MKYVKKRKTKCTKCKKLKTLARFGEVDMFWGNFKTCSWCKVCDRKLDKQREKSNKKGLKQQEKHRQNIIDGKLKMTSDGRFIKPKRGERFIYTPL